MRAHHTVYVKKGPVNRAILALLARTRGRPQSFPDKVERILVTVIAGIGDCILATPAIRSLRRLYPEARIVVVVNQRVDRILAGWSMVDEVVPFDLDRLQSGILNWCNLKFLIALLRTLKKLRRERFDLAVNLMQIASLRGAVLAGLGLKAIGARYRAGRDTDGRGAAFHLRIPDSYPGRRHAVLRNLAVAEALGGQAEHGPMVMPLGPKDRQEADNFLAAHGPPDRPLIALHPWVYDPARQWPLTSWARVAEELVARYGAALVLLGGPKDASSAEELAKALPTPPLVASGALSLRETGAIIERCDLFVGALSGPLHMAAALGTPIVACYPRELSEAYAPYTDPGRYRILTPQSHSTPLSEIPPSAVIEAAEELIKHAKLPPPKEVLSWHRTEQAEPSARTWSVAHIITRLDRGGSTDTTLLSALGMDPARYRVSLIAGLTQKPPKMMRRLMDRSDIDVHFVPTLLRAMRPLADLRAFWEIYRICRRDKFDLVHTNSSKAGILGRWAAWLAGCRRLVHTPHGHVFTGYYGPALSRVFVFTERLTAKITDTIITLTAKGIEDHLAWRVAPREKFVAVPSGIELEHFSPGHDGERLAARSALGLPRDGLIVGSVGRLDKVKGYDQLIEASVVVLQNRPDAWFAVAGDGEERKALAEQACRLGVAHRWRFLGWQENLNQVYRAFDLSVLPSRNEGMGRTAVEAMACGLPVVATAVGGLPSVIENGVNGLLVPPESPLALADSILRLLEDEDARREMGAAGPTRARKLFSKEIMLEGIERIYNRLLTPPDESEL